MLRVHRLDNEGIQFFLKELNGLMDTSDSRVAFVTKNSICEE